MLRNEEVKCGTAEGLYNAKYCRKLQFLPICDRFTEQLEESLPSRTSRVPHLEL